MPDEENRPVHFTQLLAQLLEGSFPELGKVPIWVEYRDDAESFTSNEYHDQRFSIYVGEELRDAPEPAKLGALAEELGKIAKKVKNPRSYNRDVMMMSIFPEYRVIVAREENLDLIKRGLGHPYTAYTIFLAEKCNYKWTPTDGYDVHDLDQFERNHHTGWG